jgi:hypothetical protein
MNKQPELIIDQYGNICWKLNGKYHREDGPAFETTGGIKKWCLNGLLHRVDGPAIIFPDGFVEWWFDGCPYSKEKWFNLLTPEQQYNYFWNLDE